MRKKKRGGGQCLEKGEGRERGRRRREMGTGGGTGRRRGREEGEAEKDDHEGHYQANQLGRYIATHL